MINSNLTILIVDDEPEFNITLLRKILESEGFNVLEADNGVDARQIAKESNPDLILLDVMMPIEDGYTTCYKLKKDHVTMDIPVIFISSMDESTSKLKGFKMGAVDYITKPFDQAEVLARTRIHLKLRVAIKTILDDQKKKLKGLAQAQKDILVKSEDMPEANFSVFYKSLYEVGGDFYEVMKLGNDIYGYFCTDICGHDLGSSLATSAFKALLPQNTGLLYTPEDSLKMINNVLFNILPEDGYLTTIYTIINRKKGLIKIANAGHTYPIYQPLKGDIEVLDSHGDMLGMFDNVTFETKEFKAVKGDRLYLYTDGLIESDGEKTITRSVGLKRLLDILGKTRDMKLSSAVDYTISNLFPSLENIDDDILLMGIDI